MRLTAGEQLRVQRFVAQGNSPQMAAKIVGHNIKDVCRYLRTIRKRKIETFIREPVRHPRPTQCDKKIETVSHPYVAKMRIPARVYEERDRVFSSPYNAFAAILGDPRPGRSALDKKRAPMSW